MKNTTGRAIIAVLGLLTMEIASVASVRAQDTEPPDLWRLLMDLTYSGAAGNQNLSFLDGGLRVTRLEPEVAEFEANARARSGTDDGERVAESYLASLRADAFPAARWSPFLFASAERDRFKELDLRTNAGGGVKYTFVRAEGTEVALSLAALHNREDFRVANEAVATDARLSWRFKGAHQVRDGIRAENVSFYQPVYDEPDDYIMQSESIIAVQMLSMLALTTSYVYQRDSTPPVGVESVDHHVKLGIQFQL